MMDILYVTTTSNSSTTINSESITSINSIPDLLCYYDASGLVINTTNSFGSVDSSGYVSSWNNLAPNYISNTLVQQNSLNQPKLDISGNTQSLFFNGTLSNYFMFTNMFSLYRSTLVLIFKPNTDITSASAGMVLLNSSSAQTIQCYYGFGNLTGNMVGEMNYLYSSNVRGSFTKNGTI